MKNNYEIITNFTGATTILRHNEDGSISTIPADEGNSDYARYLRWLENPEAEQSTPILPE
jgi:hypothetical protein